MAAGGGVTATTGSALEIDAGRGAGLTGGLSMGCVCVVEVEVGLTGAARQPERPQPARRPLRVPEHSIRVAPLRPSRTGIEPESSAGFFAALSAFAPGCTALDCSEAIARRSSDSAVAVKALG